MLFVYDFLSCTTSCQKLAILISHGLTKSLHLQKYSYFYYNNYYNYYCHYVADRVDYTASNSVMVDPSDSRVCVSITAIQDNVDEPDEDFMYTIASDNSYSISLPSFTTITITPGRSKEHYLSYHFVIHFP